MKLNVRTGLQNLKADSKISEQRAAQDLLCWILSVYKMKHPSILMIDRLHKVCLTPHQRHIFFTHIKAYPPACDPKSVNERRNNGSGC